MCVICTAPRGHMPDMKRLEAMAQANPDGMGYALRTPDGFYRSAKSDDARPLLDYIGSRFEVFEECDVLLHFRLATHGMVCADNCQPLALSDGTFFAHNGIAWDYVSGPHECDSYNLADAWDMSHDPTVFRNNAVGVATLDGEGLHWLHGGLPLPGDAAIGVSNLHWLNNM